MKAADSNGSIHYRKKRGAGMAIPRETFPRVNRNLALSAFRNALLTTITLCLSWATTHALDVETHHHHIRANSDSMGGTRRENPATAAAAAATAAVRQQSVREAIVWAWKGYRLHAWGADELRPVSRGESTWFGLGITIVDSLDTLWLAGEEESFRDGVAWVKENLRFDADVDVNVFETTIRVLGGLLGAYHLSGEPELLRLAGEIGEKLSAAFKSPSGIAYSDVNLRKGFAFNPKHVDSSLAESTTLSLEFTSLGAATGRSEYGRLVKKCMRRVAAAREEWMRGGREDMAGLAPIHLDPKTGRFKQSLVTMGARADSYYEYLLKMWIMDKSNNGWYLEQYREAVAGIQRRLVARSKPNGWVYVGEIPSRGSFSPKQDHLACFLPGLLALGTLHGADNGRALSEESETEADGSGGGGGIESHLGLAKALMQTCYKMYEVTETGLSPEIVYFNDGKLGNARDYKIEARDAHSILRPETVESLYYLHFITGDPTYREMGWNIFQAIELHARVHTGGYAGISDVNDPENSPLLDKMESFFLSETLKYLYLLFGAENQLPFDQWVLNTEAHPMPVFGTASAAVGEKREGRPGGGAAAAMAAAAAAAAAATMAAAGVAVA